MEKYVLKVFIMILCFYIYKGVWIYFFKIYFFIFSFKKLFFWFIVNRLFNNLG